MAARDVTDDVIALVLSTVFALTSMVLALTGRIEELRAFVQSWAPFISAIIGFYFGSKRPRQQ